MDEGGLDWILEETLSTEGINRLPREVVEATEIIRNMSLALDLVELEVDLMILKIFPNKKDSLEF